MASTIKIRQSQEQIRSIRRRRIAIRLVPPIAVLVLIVVVISAVGGWTGIAVLAGIILLGVAGAFWVYRVIIQPSNWVNKSSDWMATYENERNISAGSGIYTIESAKQIAIPNQSVSIVSFMVAHPVRHDSAYTCPLSVRLYDQRGDKYYLRFAGEARPSKPVFASILQRTSSPLQMYIVPNPVLSETVLPQSVVVAWSVYGYHVPGQGPAPTRPVV